MSKFDWFLLCLVIVVASVMVLVVCLQLPQTESQEGQTTSLKHEKVPVRRISPLPKEKKTELGVVEKPMADESQVFVRADLNEALYQARIKLAEARQRSSLQPASLSSEPNSMEGVQIRTR